MKVKTVFLLFNGVIIFFLLILGIAPRIMERESMGRFGPFLLVFLILVLLFLNIYYFFNGKILSLLERDDWPALIQYLEGKVLRKGQYNPRFVQLLAQSYLILSDTASVVNLENKTKLANPALIETYALIFGTARIIEKDITGAENFFHTRLQAVKPNKKDMPWMRFYYGFTLLLNWRFQEAAEEFIALIKFSNNTVLIGLSAWFLYDILSKALPDRRTDITAIFTAGQASVKAAIYDNQEWDSKVSKMQKEVHIAFLTQYLKETGKWIFTP
jgi:hypothetical protein